MLNRRPADVTDIKKTCLSGGVGFKETETGNATENWTSKSRGE